MFVDKVASNVLYVIYTNCNIRSFWKCQKFFYLVLTCPSTFISTPISCSDVASTSGILYNITFLFLIF